MERIINSLRELKSISDKLDDEEAKIVETVNENKAKIEKLKLTVSAVGMSWAEGLIVLDSDRNIELINEVARRLLRNDPEKIKIISDKLGHVFMNSYEDNQVLGDVLIRFRPLFDEDRNTIGSVALLEKGYKNERREYSSTPRKEQN